MYECGQAGVRRRQSPNVDVLLRENSPLQNLRHFLVCFQTTVQQVPLHMHGPYGTTERSTSNPMSWIFVWEPITILGQTSLPLINNSAMLAPRAADSSRWGQCAASPRTRAPAAREATDTPAASTAPAAADPGPQPAWSGEAAAGGNNTPVSKIGRSGWRGPQAVLSSDGAELAAHTAGSGLHVCLGGVVIIFQPLNLCSHFK